MKGIWLPGRTPVFEIMGSQHCSPPTPTTIVNIIYCGIRYITRAIVSLAIILVLIEYNARTKLADSPPGPANRSNIVGWAHIASDLTIPTTINNNHVFIRNSSRTTSKVVFFIFSRATSSQDLSSKYHYREN